MPIQTQNEAPIQGFARPVGGGIRTAPLPGAGTTDTVGSDLQRLGQSLLPLGANIGRFIQKRDAAQAEADILQGERDFENNRLEFKKAVEAGIVPEGASPHYIRAYQRSSLRVKAGQFDRDLNEAYNSTEGLRDPNGDPEAFEKWSADFIRGWREDNLQGLDDQAVAASFNPLAIRAERELTGQHIGAQIEETEERAYTSFKQEIVDELEGNQFSPQGSADYLREVRAEMVRNGMPPKRANKALIEAITGSAVELHDEDVLDVLDGLTDGEGRPLSRTAEGREAVFNAVAKIDARAFADEDRQWKNDNRIKTQKKHNIAAEYIRFAQENDYDLDATDPGEFLQRLHITDPGAVKAVHSIASAFNTNNERINEDIPLIAGMLEDIGRSEDLEDFPERLSEAVRTGRLDPDRAARFLDDYRAVADDGESRVTLQRKPFYKPTVDGISKALKGLDEFGLESAATNVAIADAEADFALEADMFFRDNPDASDTDVLKAIREIQQDVVKRHAPGGEQQQEAPSSAPSGNVFTQSPASETSGVNPFLTQPANASEPSGNPFLQ